MKKKKYKIKAKLWVYPGNAAWHFLTVPKPESHEIKENFGKNARGFGSLPVNVKIGKTKWKTSIFPDRRSGTYLLPIKAKVRQSEGVFERDSTEFSIEVGI